MQFNNEVNNNENIESNKISCLTNKFSSAPGQLILNKTVSSKPL